MSRNFAAKDVVDMMPRIHSIFALFIFLIVAIRPCDAAGSAPVPIGVLINSSDAAVIGKITDVGVLDGRITLTIEVRKNLMGELEAGRLVPVDLLANIGLQSAPRQSVNDDLIVFLKLIDGKWHLQPVLSGYIPELRSAYFRLPPDSKPLRVLSSTSSPYARVLTELFGAMVQAGGMRLDWGIDFGWESRKNNDPEVQSLFMEAASSPHLKLQTLGFLVATRKGADSAFDQIEGLINEGEFGRLSEIEEELRFHFEATDAQSIARLGRIATKTEAPQSLKKACLTALARIHSKTALPYLAEFLGSDDIELQTLAVGGLAMFANNVPIGGYTPGPGTWEFRTEETLRYSAMDPTVLSSNPNIVAFWVQWWNEHRGVLVGN